MWDGTPSRCTWSDFESCFTFCLTRNETCVVRNTSKIHVFRHNSTLVHGKAAAPPDTHPPTTTTLPYGNTAPLSSRGGAGGVHGRADAQRQGPVHPEALQR